MSEWGKWTACSATCGDGVRRSFREVLMAAANGGEACPALARSEPCKDAACAVPDAPCENDCNQRGACQDGVCQCNGGWFGFDCGASAVSAEPPYDSTSEAQDTVDVLITLK